MHVTADLLKHHARLAYSQFVAFAAHVFQQDGQVQFATAHHFKNAFFVSLFDAQRDIVLQLFLQTIPNLAAGDIFTLAARQRAGVNAEVHRQRGLINLEHRQRCGGE